MNINNFEFKIRDFYKMAIVCFTIIIFGSSYSLSVTWSLLDLGAIVSRIATIVFNFALVLLFGTLLKQTPPESSDTDTEQDMKEVLEELKDEE